MKTGARPQSVRLARPTRVALLVVGIGLLLSGSLWLLFHHLLVTEGAFGLQANPWEPFWLELHGALAFAAVWLFGFLWGVHVVPAWPLWRHRLSGSALIGTLMLLTASGYCLYYIGDDALRSVTSVLHWGLGLASPALYVLHRRKFP